LWFSKPAWPDVPIEEIKKRARLLVIDDNDFPYQSLFERDGYVLEKWSDVDDLTKLESGFFDLLLLDLQGVGREQSNEQGLGILRHLRQTAPALVIIAYSSADWPLKYQEFFRLADAVLSKSSDYVDFKRKVDELLQDRFSLGFYVGRIKAIVGQIDDLPKLEKAAKEAILERKPQKLKGFLDGRVANAQAIANALSVVQTAISIASLWKN
jgi:CheY-like chemotaxis protein